jgi:hypothetical protein
MESLEAVPAIDVLRDVWADLEVVCRYDLPSDEITSRHIVSARDKVKLLLDAQGKRDV